MVAEIFPRSPSGTKDRRSHTNFGIVESVRSTGAHLPYRKALLTTGELNAELEAAWTKSIAAWTSPDRILRQRTRG